MNSGVTFINQARQGECTLTTQMMLFKRRAIIEGNSSWDKVNRERVRSAGWVNGVGVKYNYTLNIPGGGEDDISMSIGNININQAVGEKIEIIKSLLDEHSEGIGLKKKKNGRSLPIQHSEPDDTATEPRTVL